MKEKYELVHWKGHYQVLNPEPPAHKFAIYSINEKSKWKKRTNKPFLFNKVNPFKQDITITLYHYIHIQHVLLLNHQLNLCQQPKQIQGSFNKKQKPFNSQVKKNSYYTKKSTFMMSLLQELDNIGPSLITPDLTLLFKNSEARDSYTHKGFDFVCLETSSQQWMKLVSHACPALYSAKSYKNGKKKKTLLQDKHSTTKEPLLVWEPFYGDVMTMRRSNVYFYMCVCEKYCLKSGRSCEFLYIIILYVFFRDFLIL